MGKDIILITGASSGYGKATAELFCKQGYTVVITGRNVETLEAVASEIGAVPFACDATLPEDWQKLCDFIETEYGRIDLLINNAGGGVAIKGIAEQSFDEIDRSIRLNLNSVIYGCGVFAPMFEKQKRGTIINISSVCAKHAWQGWSVYAAAKSGVLTFTKGLAVELAPHGVRVTCIIPGAGDTNFDRNAGFGERGSVPGLKAGNIAETIFALYSLPDNVWVEEATVWGIDQVVIPL